MRRSIVGGGLAALLLLLGGCAAVPPAQDAAAPDDGEPPSLAADPWEASNRAIFAFNQDLDAGLIYPWTSAYVTLVPPLARRGVTNFFNNAEDLWSAVNNLLQGKVEQSIAMSFRFAWNTVFGWAGILDLATELGIERSPEDFGQTLAVWGMPPGNFLMLPFFGPSTVRDTIALPLDVAATPAYAINQGSFRPVTTVVQIIDTRAQLLDATRLMNSIALDPYSFVRDAYLTRRFGQADGSGAPDAPPPAAPAKDPKN